MPEERDLNRLLKYEGSIDKQLYRAIKELQRHQKERGGEREPAPENTDVAVHTENTN